MLLSPTWLRLIMQNSISLEVLSLWAELEFNHMPDLPFISIFLFLLLGKSFQGNMALLSLLTILTSSRKKCVIGCHDNLIFPELPAALHLH